jgi:hypothetical protein
MQEQDYNRIINDFIQTNQFTHIKQIPFKYLPEQCKSIYKTMPRTYPQRPSKEVLQQESKIIEPL